MSAKLDQSALTVPLTVPQTSRGKGKANVELIEQSLSLASASAIISWRTELTSEDAIPSLAPQGLAVGCNDGSIYILRPTGRANASSVQSPANASAEPLSPTTTARRHIGLGRPSSRSASPSSTKSALSPFHVTRSRIVSSVSTEQAEAPKNYVDFDDEQERLRGMLKGKGHRERHASTSRTRSDPVSEKITATQTTSYPGSSLRKDDTRSYLSAAHSPSPSTLSLLTSTPPSPTYAPDRPLDLGLSHYPTLLCHAFPPHSSARRPVSSIKVHEGGRYITCLNEAGGLSVHSTTDGACLVSVVIAPSLERGASGSKPQAAPSMLWVWRTLLVAASEESILLFACASPDEFFPVGQFNDAGSDSDYQSLVVAYELRIGTGAQTGENELEYLGQWSLEAPVNSIGLRASEDHVLTLFYANSSGRLISRSLRVNDALPPSPPDLPDSHSSTHLPLPNPFKVLKSLSTDHIPDTVKDAAVERIEIEDEVDNGDIGLPSPVIGLRAQGVADDVRLCAWSSMEMLVLPWTGSTLKKSSETRTSTIQDVKWIDHESISVLFSDRVELYHVSSIAEKEQGSNLQTQLAQTIPFTAGDIAALVPGGHVVSTHVKHGRRRVHYTSLDPAISDSSAKTRTLWKARKEVSTESETRISSMLPHELDSIIIGYADGLLSRTTLFELARHSSDSSQKSDMPLPGAIVSMEVVKNHRTGERALIGGADDGTIAVWSHDTLKLCARWTLFTTPLARVISLEDEKVGRLHGCALCISQDGTIAVIAIDGYQFVYLVPASAAPLTRVCLGEDNLLLIYGDGRSRLWDTRTREFWRSLSNEKAEELVRQGAWFQWVIGGEPENRKVLFTSTHISPDAASTLFIDVSTLLRQFSSSAALAGTNVPGLSPKAKLECTRALLSMLLTFGVSEGIDSICMEALSISPCPCSVGMTNAGFAFSLLPQPSPSSAWTISSEASADRALAILSLLQYLTQFEDLVQDANTVMTFYAVSIGQLVHEAYQPPSLPRLGHYLLHTRSADVRYAARLLFDAGVARLSAQKTAEIVERWQEHLPALKPERERDWTQSALAMCICGFIAVDKYSLLPTSTLTDIAKSVAAYLHDETSPHRSLAIDLCSRGFQVWQQYVDAVEMLRALCNLATTTKKEAISVPNIGHQARTAVLQIAASNTPLFMTTLAIDILHPRSVQHRKSVMQLVIFLIRKKPLVLYSNLPRLVEAIVKSLDPNSNATREAVLDSATEILSHIVRTFPTVDFHMGSQRLAVGTSEGAVVMYDLKTATRLYVLEGHKKRTTACSFSPDGRRLVTVSLEESDVLVWKVGSSFTSFFMPGAPPRQGHSGSEPFKTLNFNIGDAAHMPLEATLAHVQFEWTADRNVRLKIQDTTLTFST
ncbi:WD40 repeat-like protein [Fomes fomentarius]|nr:WD40 repeat-like protein [Fomes fomentarius]